MMPGTVIITVIGHWFGYCWMSNKELKTTGEATSTEVLQMFLRGNTHLLGRGLLADPILTLLAHSGAEHFWPLRQGAQWW